MVQYGCEDMILVGDSDRDPTVCTAATVVHYRCGA